MKRWTVSGAVTVSVYTKGIEAETAEEAISKSEERSMQGLCHCCSGDDETALEEWSLTGELDGEPSNLVAEEEAED